MLYFLIVLSGALFFIYVRRKRQSQNASYKNDIIISLIGWTSYLLLFSINPDLKCLSYIFVGLVIFSVFVALICFGKLMLRLGGDDLY